MDLDQQAGPVGRQPQLHLGVGPGGLASADRVGDELGDDQFRGLAEGAEVPACQYPAGVMPGVGDGTGKRGELQVAVQRPGLPIGRGSLAVPPVREQDRPAPVAVRMLAGHHRLHVLQVL